MLRTLVVTGGHPYQAAEFFSVFDADPELLWAHAPQPTAQRWLDPAAGTWDAIVFYDMPGITFVPGQLPETPAPSDELVTGMRKLLDAGQGMVFLHHALASWPAWEEYAEWMGGRFLYRPGVLRGERWPDSGYAFDVEQHLTPESSNHPEACNHPVLAGLEDGFTLTDETYLAPVFTDDVVPLLRSDAPYSAGHFSSAALAVQGRAQGSGDWQHPDGTNLVAWAKRARRSPVVYLQPGDGPGAYGNAGWRRFLGNAIRWVASPDAHRWACAAPANAAVPARR